jgi:PKHD-type hydroxylase
MWQLPQPSVPIEPYAWSRNVFTADELELIINLGKSQVAKEASVNDTNVPLDNVRQSKISWIFPEVQNKFIFLKISQALMDVNRTFYNYDITEIEDLQFTEYDASYNGMYRNHTDDGYDVEYYRKLSFTLQLSDADDYEGGNLQLYRFKLDNPNIVQKEKGLFTVFPSSTIHEVTPVTKGTRYTLVGWAHGPRFR